VSLSVLDIALIVAFAVIVIRVTIVGFVDEFFSKAAIVLGIALAAFLYRPLAPYVARIVGQSAWSEAIAFLAVFLAAYLAVVAIQRLLGGLFENDSLASLDRALGFFLGLLEGALLVCAVLIVLRTQRLFDFAWLLDGSVLARLLAPILASGGSLIPSLNP
jgi:membrane protein required for colicin V production